MLDENQGRSISQDELDEKGIKDMVVGVDDTYETKNTLIVFLRNQNKDRLGNHNIYSKPYDSEYDVINIAGFLGQELRWF
ncbi:hypothetical protein [Halorubrum sp. 2020YC2]|uniref:hypothetical protein n=1 Tax=Halorubrum sp. 2020YC2 TaxID=2836432 RepID=UPI001BE8C6B6|nr:hypothetical protein [Halorubrum sp. 2020YC2]QWC18043.1 hypothetical protein KI388_07530 [Halorubrum sp. 2020YC2]